MWRVSPLSTLFISRGSSTSSWLTLPPTPLPFPIHIANTREACQKFTFITGFFILGRNWTVQWWEITARTSFQQTEVVRVYTLKGVGGSWPVEVSFCAVETRWESPDWSLLTTVQQAGQDRAPEFRYIAYILTTRDHILVVNVCE